MRAFLMGLLVACVLITVACERATERPQETRQAAQSPPQQLEEKPGADEAMPESKEESSGKFTDDLWVELLARRYCLTEKHAAEAKTNPDGAAQKVAKEWGVLLSEAGITQKEWEAWTDRLAQDPERYSVLVRRAGSLVQELKAQEPQ